MASETRLRVEETCAEPEVGGHCRYCGSMSVEEAIGLLNTDGTRYSGSDQKYGYPHKFYIGVRKFYSRHLLLVGPEVVERFDKLSRTLLGVSFHVDEKGLKYRCPRVPSGTMGGWQTWGTVGRERPADWRRSADFGFGPPVPQWMADEWIPPHAGGGSPINDAGDDGKPTKDA